VQDLEAAEIHVALKPRWRSNPNGLTTKRQTGAPEKSVETVDFVLRSKSCVVLKE
jgi:hypothetical protein